MTENGKRMLKNLLIAHEGFSAVPYLDPVGKLTIGYGRNLSDRGISAKEALYLLDEDISIFHNKLAAHLCCFECLNEARQIALISMCFNLGLHAFLKFKKMIAALEIHDYALAAHEILNSKWSQQVGKRAEDLAKIIREGILT